ncbi:Crp/Fnr family transcriptional regulator [Methylicorpusculum oleiharenae]|uniref:Crp/Fnr family transcriptional regulator n=1 Tax=Methylicorpusculum oleiharenae TaxID=1338687 RepID=UPI00135B24D3|nr:Crp/Fnr family transcriptional regulator [Methylicorpusculum oleiharenae]MCD2451623.1 Crp/Fnr family transcriptional regulator [Methylicorpusculum oleiharenae]
MTKPIPEPHSPMQNHLLAALPSEIYDRILPHLEWVSMPTGKVLYESGDQLQHVYFLTTAIASLSYITENGAAAEVAGIGNEGVVGTSLLMGGKTALNRAIIHTGGSGYRLKEQLMMEEFNHTGPMRDLLLLFIQALMTQISQTAVCYRHHTVEQQLCRWLLLTLDRLPSNELTITQELIAGMLGVRREGVTEAAGNLQRAGLISYRRGHITVIDRLGLESHACECYSVVKKEFHRLLSP